jgi:hypothetical protein
MKANEIEKGELARFVRTDEGKAFLDELDKGWADCMAIAREHGFIVAAVGGTATLATYKNAQEVGPELVVRMLQMSGVEVPLGE